jgi:hypothetical protein
MSKTPTPASGTRRSVHVQKYQTEYVYNKGSHVVTGYSGSTRALKRLAEIAAMDTLPAMSPAQDAAKGDGNG